MDWKTAFDEAFPFGMEVFPDRRPPFPLMNLIVQPQPHGFPLVTGHNTHTFADYLFTDLKPSPSGGYEGVIEHIGHVRLTPLAEKNKWNYFPRYQA